MRKAVTAVVAAIVIAAPAVAHDFWLSLSKYHPKSGEIISVRTLVGDHYVGDSRPRDPTKLERFVIATPAGESPIVGRDGDEPAGFMRIGAPGTYPIAYRSSPTKVVLAGEKFEGYLKERGLDQAAAARAAAGTQAQDGRERFSRCAKSLVCVDNQPGSGFDHVFDMPLEIVPVTDPYTLKKGETLRVKVLDSGKPMGNALIIATRKADPANPVMVRTDAEGLAAVVLNGGGEWMLSVVSMRPVTDGTVDWESFWASLTFDIL